MTLPRHLARKKAESHGDANALPDTAEGNRIFHQNLLDISRQAIATTGSTLATELAGPIGGCVSVVLASRRAGPS